MLTNKRIVPANSFVMTIANNVNNKKLSDAEFRTFIRNTLPVVKYTKRRPNQPLEADMKCSVDFHKEEYLNGSTFCRVCGARIRTA